MRGIVSSVSILNLSSQIIICNTTTLLFFFKIYLPPIFVKSNVSTPGVRLFPNKIYSILNKRLQAIFSNVLPSNIRCQRNVLQYFKAGRKKAIERFCFEGDIIYFLHSLGRMDCPTKLDGDGRWGVRNVKGTMQLFLRWIKGLMLWVLLNLLACICRNICDYCWSKLSLLAYLLCRWRSLWSWKHRTSLVFISSLCHQRILFWPVLACNTLYWLMVISFYWTQFDRITDPICFLRSEKPNVSSSWMKL